MEYCTTQLAKDYFLQGNNSVFCVLNNSMYESYGHSLLATVR